MTSESKLGIDMPPEAQCPHINEYIKDAKNILDYTRDIQFELSHIEDCHVDSQIRDIDWEVGRCEDNFEELRSVIENLRAWGQEWKDLAKDLINRYEPELLEDVDDSQE